MGRRKWKNIDVSGITETLIDSSIARDAAKFGIEGAIEIDVQGRKRSGRHRKLSKKGSILEKRSDAEKVLLKRLANKIKNKRRKQEDGKPDVPVSAAEPSAMDVWGDAQDSYMQPQNPTPLKAKKSQKLDIMPPHQGQSYNPSEEDVKALIDSEVEKLPKERKRTDQPMTDAIQEAAPWLNLRDFNFTQQLHIFHLLNTGRLTREGVEQIVRECNYDEHQDNDDEQGHSEGIRRTRKLKIKTTAKRNRLKAIKVEKFKRVQQKRTKRLLHDIDNIQKLVKDVEKKTVQKTTANGNIKSKNKYVEPLVFGSVGNTNLVSLEPASSVHAIVGQIYNRGILPPPPTLDAIYKARVRGRSSRKSQISKKAL